MIPAPDGGGQSGTESERLDVVTASQTASDTAQSVCWPCRPCSAVGALQIFMVVWQVLSRETTANKGTNTPTTNDKTSKQTKPCGV